MKNVILGIVGVVAVGALVFLGAAAMQPSALHVERSVLIAATPADVFPYANDFEQWQRWNPWRDMDPSQKETFSENKVGVGAWYTWEGNDEVGKGRMTIRESVQDQKVVEDLHFIEPFESKPVVTFTLAAEGDKTKVTWGFDNEQDFKGKAFGMVMDMDAMLGADFQRGLDKLKPLAETTAMERVEAERVAAEAAANTAASLAVAAEGGAPAAGETAGAVK
ncbi:MAG: SRPBCC family protein [Pseudomonadota bacterium]|nr:SRPBCC family protein [Pseudomonadota bacterium]